MKSELVSVIIPTYNRAHLIGRAIQSVLNQTYKNMEIIIADDGSTDNTEEIVKSFQDKRIKYIKYPENKGGCAARNIGIRSSRGKYISFLDSDDEWLPEKLEKQLEVFEKSQDEKLGFVNCGTIFIDAENKKEITRILSREKDYIFKDMLENNYETGGGSSNLIKREIFDKCGFFDENLYLKKGGQQDYEMWLRIAKENKFDYAPRYLVRRYFHSKSITSMSELRAKTEAFKYVICKYKKDYEKYPKAYSGYFRGLGAQYCLAGDLKRGREKFFGSIKIEPLNFKNYLHLLVSLGGFKIYSILHSLWYCKLKTLLRKGTI